MAIKLKSLSEIEAMRKAGLLLWETHQLAASMVEPGITTAEIDAAVDHFIVSNNALPLFKGVPGAYPFPNATCISLNEHVVHGLPSERKLREGDIISLDIGIKLDGWCSDAAVSYPVGEIKKEYQQLLTTTEDILRYAIQQMGTAQRWSEISNKMQEMAETAGFSVVRELVGHAIGREMWETPQVPNYYAHDLPDFRLQPGLVLAVEPMINAGLRDVVLLSDQWTIATLDDKPSAHFEHTIAITEHGVQVLTCGPNGEGWAM